MGIFQINRLAALSYVQFWNINKTFERRGEGAGKRAGHGMMVFNVLLNKYKLFWPWPSLFGGSEWESKPGHAMGTVWGRKRSCVCVTEGLRLTATFVLVIYFFSEESNTMRNSERNTGWKAWCACDQLNRINTLQTRWPWIWFDLEHTAFVENATYFLHSSWIEILFLLFFKWNVIAGNAYLKFLAARLKCRHCTFPRLC